MCHAKETPKFKSQEMELTYTPNFKRPDTENLEEYGRFQQHLVLLEDKERIEKFHKAIKLVEPAELILDIGAGTGILSLFALKAGFKHAFLIEPSQKISSYAAYLLDKNGFSGRYTIINKSLENINPTELPNAIDLVVSETISSLIIGFESWYHYEKVLKRVSNANNIIPNHGKLLFALSEKDWATRNSKNHGLNYCVENGIAIDLYERTFRSGGNIFDKNTINETFSENSFSEILSFDFRKQKYLNDLNNEIVSKSNTTYLGILFYWIISLDSEEKVLLNSRNSKLTSWYPIFIPFKKPLITQKEEILRIRLETKSVDNPYPNAFQIFNYNNPISNILYW